MSYRIDSPARTDPQGVVLRLDEEVKEQKRLPVGVYKTLNKGQEGSGARCRKK